MQRIWRPARGSLKGAIIADYRRKAIATAGEINRRGFAAMPAIDRFANVVNGAGDEKPGRWHRCEPKNPARNGHQWPDLLGRAVPRNNN